MFPPIIFFVFSYLYFWCRRRRSILPLIYLRSFVNMSAGVEEFSGKRKYVNASCGARKKYVNASCGARKKYANATCGARKP